MAFSPTVFSNYHSPSPFSFDKEDINWKRLISCWASLVMPIEGVDENFDSTIYQLIYYSSPEHFSPEVQPNPKMTGRISKFITRPPMILEE